MNGITVDWYEATIETETITLLAMMQLVAGPDDKLLITEGKGRHGYNRLTQIDGEQFHLEIFDLGNGNWPHLKASGPNAPIARDIANSLNTVGRVSRIDLACDSTEGWMPAEKRVIDWIDTHPNTVSVQMGDYYRGGTETAKDGRTWYIGATKSSRRIRVYEKGRGTDQPDWVRVEFQFRPHSRAEKAWAYDATLEQLANSSRAFVALRATNGFYTPPRYARMERQPILALAQQYGNALREHVPAAWHEIYQYLKS